MRTPTHVPLLVIGAGPFGLAVSGYARRHGIEHAVVGRAMGFWKANMPAGMCLRSGHDWHYDPFGEDTIERYFHTQNINRPEADPLTLDLYLGYADWFRRRKGIEVLPGLVERLDCTGGPRPRFVATLQAGDAITANEVVLALGFGYFKHVPEAYAALFPPHRCAHTCDFVELSSLTGKRLLIVGGRQSAFEWAALSREAGAEAVHLTYRHPTPSFEPSDWTWVTPLVDSIAENPGWFRRLRAEAKDEVTRRMWAEGRLKLEPWLAARITGDRIHLYPHTQPTKCEPLTGGTLRVTLSDDTAIAIDHIILATGYKVEVARIPLLANGGILPRLETRDGFPVLDDHFQSSVPGLFFTSMCAMRDFGPFFAFTVSVRASAALIGAELRRRLA